MLICIDEYVRQSFGIHIYLKKIVNKLSEFVVKETHKSLTLHDIYNHSFQLQNIVLSNHILNIYRNIKVARHIACAACCRR